MADETSSDTTITQPQPETPQEPIATPEPIAEVIEVPEITKSEPEIIEPTVLNEIPTVEEEKIEVAPPVEKEEVKVEEQKVEEQKIEEPKVEEKTVVNELPKEEKRSEVVETNPFIINMKRARELLVKARAVVQIKKRKRLDKIMKMFLKKKMITVNDVELLLHISQDSAQDYVNILKKEGKIKPAGKIGHSPAYMKM